MPYQSRQSRQSFPGIATPTSKRLFGLTSPAYLRNVNSFHASLHTVSFGVQRTGKIMRRPRTPVSWFRPGTKSPSPARWTDRLRARPSSRGARKRDSETSRLCSLAGYPLELLLWRVAGGYLCIFAEEVSVMADHLPGGSDGESR